MLLLQQLDVGMMILLIFYECLDGNTDMSPPSAFLFFFLYSPEQMQYKVWVKPSAEMSFLYGNNVSKQGLARITENTPQYAGVVVFSMSDIPLGFGVASQSTDHCQTLDPMGNVVLHQADIGEYLRGLEDEIF